MIVGRGSWEVDYRFRLPRENEIRSLHQVFMPLATAPMVSATVSSGAFY